MRYLRQAGLQSLTGCLLGVFVLSLFTFPVSAAQSTAQISGAVRDQSRAVLPGVEVKVTQTATGAVRSALSGEDGRYVLPNLPIGPYMLEASLPGFRTYLQTGIVLQVNSDAPIDVVLEVGQISETVEVQADAALVETRNSGVGTVMDNQRVLEMPLNGRQVTELIFLAGMAVQGTGQSGSLQTLRNYPTVSISITGGIPNWVTYSLDGVNNNDPYMGLNLPVPFPDALQEFKVEASALPAQYGQHASAAVNALTKSGTNEFHGNLFEFLRNGKLNARNFFAAQRDNLKRNQFGGTFGGPFRKNQLFFFGGYQGTTQRAESNANIAYVPTAEMLAGDFRVAASPACAGRQITLSAAQGFTNNQISASGLSAPALLIAKKLPLATDPCGKVLFKRINNQDESLGVVRVDYQKSDKHSLFGRFFIANLTAPSTYDGKSLLTIAANALHDRVYTLAVGDTYLFGAGLVSSLRFGATRSALPKIVDNTGTWKDFGVNASSPLGPLISLSVTGNGFTGSSGNSIYNIANTGPNPFVSEDLSVVHGTHQFGFGGQYQYQQMNYKSGVNGHGSFSFNGTVTGLSISDFLTGNAVTWRQGNANIFYNRQHYLGLYYQDSWKATDRLTVNYGLRWEPYLAIISKRGEFTHFEPALFSQNVHSTRFVNAPAGVIFPGDPQYLSGNSISSNRWNSFQPRLGLAWNPTGSGRMTIRAAFGMFTDKQTMNTTSPMAQNQPFGALVLLNNVKLSDPWANFPGGNPIPLAVNKDTVFPTAGGYISYPFKWIPTTVNQWNVSFQKQVGSDWLLTANYVGNSITHLLVGNQINPAEFLGLGPCTINGVSYPTCSTTANINQRRRLNRENPSQGQYFAVITEASNGGTGNYNGLYLAAQKRLSAGASVLANYTWSHCISDYWIYSFPSGSSNTTPGNRRNDRSNCEGRDQRQVLNFSGVLQSPTFQSRALRLLAGDWQLSPILRLKSANFFTVLTGVDNALNGEGEQRPVLVNPNPYPTDQSVDGWINASAFAAPAPGTISGLGRNNFKGPGAVQFDVGVSRSFRVREKQTLQFRLELFNIMNHANFNNPVATTNSGAFGKIQGAGDPRIIQAALKYDF